MNPRTVLQRLEGFHRTGDPAALWPALAESERVAAARELERVARSVLGGEPVELDPSRTLSTYSLAIAGHTSGVGPLTGKWIEQGRVAAAPDAAAAFAKHLLHARRRAERMEREVLPALDALIAAGITPVVLKGFHTGRAYLDEPGVRPMADVDLLIPADGVRDAERALSEIGFRPDSPALRPYKRDWIGPGVDPRLFSIELTDARSKWVLELHASLDRVYHPGAVATLDVLRTRAEPLDVAGRRLLALSPAAIVVTHACHCSQELGGARLLRLIELILVIRGARARGTFDWDDVISVLRETRAARFTYPALALANALSPGDIEPRVISLGHDASTWAARHTVARLVPAGGSLDERGALRQLMWTRGLVAVGQRILRSAWPASFVRPGDVAPGWRTRIRRLRRGTLSILAPDERRG